jgi:BirA family biotin operon repressor/biotin-[acetyl-CoA-carboxylase] ligase
MILKAKADMAADRRDYEMPDYAEDRNYSVAELLERFCRHFLSNVDQWANEGFEPARRAWLRRADGVGEPIQLNTASATLNGTFETVNEQGELVLKLSDGRRRPIPVADVLSQGQHNA